MLMKLPDFMVEGPCIGEGLDDIEDDDTYWRLYNQQLDDAIAKRRQEEVRYIIFLRSRIEEYEDYLDCNGGSPELYTELEKLQEELSDCLIQQQLYIEEDMYDCVIFHDYGLELQSLFEETKCVTHECDEEQPKVSDNYNLELDIDLVGTSEQIVEDEIMSHEIVCSEDVVEQHEFSDCSSTLWLDNVTKEDIHVLEHLPFVPSALHVQHIELIGDIVAEIEPEPPPIVVCKLLDFDDPMLRTSCLLIQQDLRTNLLKGGGNDTPIMGALGAVRENEDHHEASKGRFDSYGVFGLHGVAWKLMEAHPCLWESMEAKWMKNKHVKKKKGFVQCLGPNGLVISLIIVH